MHRAERATQTLTRPRALLTAIALIALAIPLQTALSFDDPPADKKPDAPREKPKVKLPPDTFRVNVPDFPKGFHWINTQKPLSLKEDLKGHVVILDFWTYCCINCMHILPQLEKVEHEFKDKPLVVIGVHSAKFTTEKSANNIQQAVTRHHVVHPVVVDQEMAIWNAFGTRAWPTLAVLDTKGRLVYRQSGELPAELLIAAVDALMEEGKENKTLAEKPFKLEYKNLLPPHDQLAFPGKITADPANKRLFIADSSHDRILITDTNGKVQTIIGSGARGFKDGSFSTATFRNPQGMALDADKLYIADTENHAVRVADLTKKTVTTLAGDGKRGADRFGGRTGADQPLASPWDLVIDDNTLYIAMAGTHQLWTANLQTGKFKAWVGSGVESILDRPGLDAHLSQPSGLTLLDGDLYFADSEISAVRKARLSDASVQTLIGTGLFDFGYKDGPFKQAQLQHCLGVAAYEGNILVTDTYNDALRLVDLKTKTITTLLGGPGKPDLDEPAGLTVLDNLVYIADTNNHRIIRFDPKTQKAEPLNIKVPMPGAAPAPPTPTTRNNTPSE